MNTLGKLVLIVGALMVLVELWFLTTAILSKDKTFSIPSPGSNGQEWIFYGWSY